MVYLDNACLPKKTDYFKLKEKALGKVYTKDSFHDPLEDCL